MEMLAGVWSLETFALRNFELLLLKSDFQLNVIYGSFYGFLILRAN